MATIYYTSPYVQDQINTLLLRAEMGRSNSIRACILKAWCPTEDDFVAALRDARQRGIEVQESVARTTSQQGQGLVEYAFVMALIAIAVVLILTWLGNGSFMHGCQSVYAAIDTVVNGLGSFWAPRKDILVSVGSL